MTDGLKRGTVKALAGRLGRPAWWVKKRAVTLGLTQVRIKEPEWSPAEVELLEANGHKNPDVIRRIFARKGFRRSATSIVVKRKRLAINTTNPDHFTATGLADIMGIDIKVVTRWIEAGWLKARRRGTDRTEKQGGDQWWIRRSNVRRFIIENAHAIDIRKVDKTWLIDLLANR